MGGLRGILVRLGGVLGEFGGMGGGLGLSSWDLGGLGFDRTRPRVQSARGGRSGRQALRVLGKSAHAYACASGRCAHAYVCVLLGKRARHQTAPDLNSSRRSLFASSEEFGGGLGDTSSSSTGANIYFRATLIQRDLRREVLGISYQHLARSGLRGMEDRGWLRLFPGITRESSNVFGGLEGC